MPLYVYECPECAIEIEERCALDRAPLLVECPICHELCRPAVTAAVVRRAAPEPPRYGQIPAGYHGAACPCCSARPRR